MFGKTKLKIMPPKPFIIDYCAAREILDSRSKPTLEVEMRSGMYTSKASVPSGKSTGLREAMELRDDKGGVRTAIININQKIIPEIVGKEFSSVFEIDDLLLRIDGTENKSNLGANTTLAISTAVTKLVAVIEKKPVWKFISELNDAKPSLPKLFMNVINGGVHGSFNLPFQEYMIVPQSDSVKESIEQAQNILTMLAKEMELRYGVVVMGDEGGYAPNMPRLETPFELLLKIIKDTGFEVKMAIDAAASEFYKEDGKYEVLNQRITVEKLASLYENLAWQYPIVGIEDPFEEHDYASFAKETQYFSKKVRPVSLSDGNGSETKTLIVGDDITVTNKKIMETVAKERAINAVIIKPNQIGTLKEVYDAVKIARENDWKIICSHRSGETMDTFIADLAVGLGAFGIKAGSPLQKERAAKYERLVEIEGEMN